MSLYSSTSLRYLILTLVLFLSAGALQRASAQTTTEPTEADHLFQVSVLPGLSTSADTRSTSNISLNILAGSNGAFYGFELGSLLNVNRYDVQGGQFSGLVNVNQQRAQGFVVGGLFNYTGSFQGVNASGMVTYNHERSQGVLLSGALTYTQDFTNGVMASGSFNIIPGSANGLLLSGGLNIVGEQQSGLMMAGGLNLARESHGVHISPLNMAESNAGVQFGVLNISKRQTGTQIGLLNVVAEESEGTSVGLLSFVAGGRSNIDIWGSETGFLNMGLRIGTEQIYNVIGVGYNLFHGPNLWQVGLGIGYYQPIGERGAGFETDLLFFHLNHDDWWTSDISNHAQWRLHLTTSLSDWLGLFVGPSLNLMIIDQDLSIDHVPYAVAERIEDDIRLQWWVGGTLGFQFN